jgi:N-acyl-D-glutamate deacylase
MKNDGESGSDLSRRAAQATTNRRPNEVGPFDLIISGGRIIDPETGFDSIGNVGIKGGRIAAISQEPLVGNATLPGGGQIVAPGFIDLHAHGQELPAAWVRAFDGVTTQLDLEAGRLPVGRYYELVAKEGRPINYGVSSAWGFARVAEKEKIEPDGTISFFQRAFALGHWQKTLATPEELARIIDRVETGLKDGGLGIGVLGGYAPGYGHGEYYELAKLAAKYGVPTYTHMRYLSAIEPHSTFEALEELVALSAATGAHMHVCHLNSNAVRDVVRCAELLKGAQARGLPISVEAYPYGAAFNGGQCRGVPRRRLA